MKKVDFPKTRWLRVDVVNPKRGLVYHLKMSCQRKKLPCLLKINSHKGEQHIITQGASVDQILATQNVAHRLAALTSPKSLRLMQMLAPTPDFQNQKPQFNKIHALSKICALSPRHTSLESSHISKLDTIYLMKLCRLINI